VFCLVLAVLLFWTHRGNLKRHFAAQCGDRRMKFAILGNGGFGTAMAMALDRAGTTWRSGVTTPPTQRKSRRRGRTRVTSKASCSTTRSP
jgi:hypothetical protein